MHIVISVVTFLSAVQNSEENLVFDPPRFQTCRQILADSFSETEISKYSRIFSAAHTQHAGFFMYDGTSRFGRNEFRKNRKLEFSVIPAVTVCFTSCTFPYGPFFPKEMRCFGSTFNQLTFFQSIK